MNIVVCVKRVYDIEKAWFHKGSGEIRGEFITNPVDKNAIQMALDLRNQVGGRIVAVSAGPEESKSCLREALAMGCDEAIHLRDEAFKGSDEMASALILGSAITKMEFDLILCGSHTIDYGGGQIGPRIASFLRIPQITNILSAHAKEGRLVARRKIEDAILAIETTLPALLTVCPDANQPRRPTALEIMKAHRKEIRTWGSADIGLDPSMVGFTGSPSRITEISP